MVRSERRNQELELWREARFRKHRLVESRRSDASSRVRSTRESWTKTSSEAEARASSRTRSKVLEMEIGEESGNERSEEIIESAWLWFKPGTVGTELGFPAGFVGESIKPNRTLKSFSGVMPESIISINRSASKSPGFLLSFLRKCERTMIIWDSSILFYFPFLSSTISINLLIM